MVLKEEILDDKEASIPDLLAQLAKPKPKGKIYRLGMWDDQWRFIHARAHGKREVLYSGGKGAGKSYSLLLALMRYVDVPGTSVILSRLHFSTLKKTTLSDLMDSHTVINRFTGEERFIPAFLSTRQITKYNSNDGIITLRNGSKIYCIGASDTEKVKGMPNIVAAFIDELTDLSDKQYRAISTRVRVSHPYGNVIMSCTNPSHKSHWAYDYFTMFPSRQLICSASFKNKFLSQEYLDSLAAQPEVIRRQELYGEWTDVADCVFACFNVSEHVQDTASVFKSPHIVDYYIGQDYGGAGKGYAGMVLIGVHQDGRIFCFDEFCKARQSHQNILDWMEKYRDLTKGRVIYDSANAAIAIDMQNAGWETIKCRPKDIEGEVKTMNNLFSTGQLVIDKKCDVLKQQLLKSYRSAETGGISKIAEWDVIDAYRYACCVIHNDEILPSTTHSNFWVYKGDI